VPSSAFQCAVFLAGVLCTATSCLTAQVKYTPDSRYRGQTVWDLPKAPEKSIDIGLWAFIIAKEYDPSVDVKAGLATLDSMAAEVRRMLAGRQRDMDKFLAVRMFLFEPGRWNNNHPFSYDLDDPFGSNTLNKLLPTFLMTRKGNCVSMPTLMLALMERVDPGVRFCGVLAPQHLLCRYRDRQTMDAFNVEPTNGGHPARNEWVIQELNISQTAVDKGAYLRDLTKKEVLAVLLEVLATKYRQQGEYRTELRYGELMTRIAPNLILGLMRRTTAQLAIYDVYEERRVATETGATAPLTSRERREQQSLYAAIMKTAKRIKAMGWVPETDEQRARYLQRIEDERQRREQ